MTTETFLKIINSKSERLSQSEIEAIMDEELEKSPDEMDTDLIERCLDALTEKNSFQPKVKLRRSIFARIAVAAVVFSIIVLFSFPAGAKFFHANVPNGLVEFYGSYFNVDISNNETIDDIEGKLRHNGIENPVLPRIVYLLDTEVSNYSYQTDSNGLVVEFSITNSDINAQFVLKETENSFPVLPLDASNAKQVESGKIQAFVYSKGEDATISYVANDIQYDITLNCDLQSACEIATTL